MSLRARVASNLSPTMKARARSVLRPLGMTGERVDYAAIRHMRAMLAGLAIDTVIDVGANIGQFGRFMREDVGYKGEIVSLEPTGSVYAALQRNAAADPAWITHRLGAGSEAGTLAMNVSDNPVFNSLLRKTHGLFDSVKVTRTEPVPIVRLDALFANHKGKRVFLKVDTQGFDLEVIRGASGIMDRVQAIQTELSFVPAYEGSPAFDEVIREMSDLGFVVSNMTPVSMTGLQAVEFDCLLVRKADVIEGVSYPNFIKSAPRL